MKNELPQIHVSRLKVEGRTIWFRSCVAEASTEEMKVWGQRYLAEARLRGPRYPLVVDVESDRLRPSE